MAHSNSIKQAPGGASSTCLARAVLRRLEHLELLLWRKRGVDGQHKQVWAGRVWGELRRTLTYEPLTRLNLVLRHTPPTGSDLQGMNAAPGAMPGSAWCADALLLWIWG